MHSANCELVGLVSDGVGRAFDGVGRAFDGVDGVGRTFGRTFEGVDGVGVTGTAGVGFVDFFLEMMAATTPPTTPPVTNTTMMPITHARMVLLCIFFPHLVGLGDRV